MVTPLVAIAAQNFSLAISKMGMTSGGAGASRSSVPLKFDADVGDVAAARPDADGLRSAIGCQRDRGAESHGADLAFKLVLRDPPSEISGHVSRDFGPISLDRLAGGFGVAPDVELEAFTGAHDRQIDRRAVLQLGVF